VKSAAFDYVKPAAMAELFELLQSHGDDARILAGGQTLLATLNMRLSEPKLVIDITGSKSCGAFTKWVTVFSLAH